MRNAVESGSLQCCWHHRSLLRALVMRDIKSRYTGSLAGMLWALLHPLALLGVYAVVFAHVFQIRVPGLAPDQPYLLFVASALWPWLATQEAITRGTMAVQNHATLVNKVAFPHELLVYASALASFAVHLSGYVAVLLALRLGGYAVHFSQLPVLVLGLLVLLVLSISIALVLGALQVFVRDVEHVLTQFMGILFYATPILYSLALVPTWMQAPMQWNPLMHILQAMREALLLSADPNPTALATMLGGVALAFYLARKFFLRLSPYFEDMV